MLDILSDGVKTFLNWVIGVITVGALTKLITPLAGLLGVVWYGVLIHDRIKYGPQKGEQ